MVGFGPRMVRRAERYSALPYHLRAGNRIPVRVTVGSRLTRAELRVRRFDSEVEET
jgi:hypothetical protein